MPKTKSSEAKVCFELEAAGAKQVLLAADFTNWERGAEKMTRSRKLPHLFTKRLGLSPGVYQYKFIVDGEWREDPRAESVLNDLGTRNSLCRVG